MDPKPAELEAELGLSPAPAAPAKVSPRLVDTPPPMTLDPLPHAIEAPTRLQPSLEPAAAKPVRAPGEIRDTARANEATDSADRLAAKGVFSAKKAGRTSATSRAPFYAVLGLLLLAGAGAAYYVWSETQPAAGLIAKGPAASAAGPINTGPPAAAMRDPSVLPPVGPLTTPAPSVASTTPPEGARPLAVGAPPPTPVPGMRPTPETPAPIASPAAPPATPQAAVNIPAAHNEPRSTNASVAATAPSARGDVSARGGTPVATPTNLRITRDRPAASVDPAVNAGYAALVEGNLEAARENYNRALDADNTNRDALLGLAAVATRTGRGDVAENLYQRVLELHPRDPYASAQLTTLRNGADSAVAESRVKALLANEREPVGAAPLQFALGNQMAAQGRWGEAQQAYFSAYGAESDNPDYCYNLAVSLDQLHQPKLAHDFYAKAIALASKRRAGFDTASAKARLEQLANSVK
jgi:Tfp pilus assembly protein PilF